MSIACDVNIGTTGLASSVAYTVYSDMAKGTIVTNTITGTCTEAPSGSGIYGVQAVGASYGNCVVFSVPGQAIYASVLLVNPIASSGNVTVGGYASGQDPATLLAASFATVNAGIAALATTLAGMVAAIIAAMKSDSQMKVALTNHNLGKMTFNQTTNVQTVYGDDGTVIGQNNLMYDSAHNVASRL